MSKNEVTVQIQKTRRQRLVDWLEDPMGSVIVASVVAIGSLGVVISGIWVVDAVIV